MRRHGGFAIVAYMTGPITLNVKRLLPEAKLPLRATEGAAGLDLYACLPDGDVTLGPDPVRVSTGVAIECPVGYDAQIRPRSGLS